MDTTAPTPAPETDASQDLVKRKLKPGRKVSPRKAAARARSKAYAKAHPKKRGPKPGSKRKKKPTPDTGTTSPAATSDDATADNSYLALKPSPRHIGRPSTCSVEIFTEVCARMAHGEFLTSICDDPDMPSYFSVIRWLESNPAFRPLYTQTRRTQAQWWVEKGALIVAEATDPRVANLARLKFDAFKYLASKLDPDNYAEKTGGAGVTVNVLVAERASSARKTLLADLASLESGAHLIEGEAREIEFEG